VFTIFRTQKLSAMLFWNTKTPTRLIFNKSGDQIAGSRDILGIGVADNHSHRTVYIGLGRLVFHFNYIPRNYIPFWANAVDNPSNVVYLDVFRGKRCKK